MLMSEMEKSSEQVRKNEEFNNSLNVEVSDDESISPTSPSRAYRISSNLFRNVRRQTPYHRDASMERDQWRPEPSNEASSGTVREHVKLLLTIYVRLRVLLDGYERICELNFGHILYI